MPKIDKNHWRDGQAENHWRDVFDPRQRALIANCCIYAESEQTGMAGHTLAMIIAQMEAKLDEYEAIVNEQPKTD